VTEEALATATTSAATVAVPAPLFVVMFFITAFVAMLFTFAAACMVLTVVAFVVMSFTLAAAFVLVLCLFTATFMMVLHHRLLMLFRYI
jgi:hypothetical protein